ncbi:MAG: thymidine phosphorylase [Chloroflexi bacterium]|nr:thymidine phosphorylase [Chloroflexota bacterium]
MRAVDIIAAKRDGHAHSPAEIAWLIRGCVSGEIPDYQLSAWLMAAYLRGLDRSETAALTRAMAESGRVLDLGDLASSAVDKHSSGGVGDKTTLVATPIAAAAGVIVPKMSGRGLGFTGGTLDKLEAIPGLRVDLGVDRILAQAREVGLVIASQTADLAPADGKLYALRDVTATVDSLPLIVSSILSKKLAGGAPAFVLDVKAGHGAFMPTLARARELAQLLVDIGTECGRRVVAIISAMDQPLGWAVGNAVEVREAIETLRGGGPADLRDLAITLAGEMLQLAGRARSVAEAEQAARDALFSGRALERLGAMIRAQGGDERVLDEPDRLPTAPVQEVVRSDRNGFIAELDARQVGMTVTALGAGRERKGDPVDHRIGVVFHHKVGDRVDTGDPLFTLHLADPAQVAVARERLLAAYRWSSEPVPYPAVVLDRIG